jgi:acetyl-CoA carboxylase biotin carboxylase subunit
VTRAATATRDIRRVLIANRGEIAVRIVSACRTLGLETVAAVSDADRDSLAARVADHAVVVGPAPAAQSYLRAERLVEAALVHGCEAVHPGYGFLSERAPFARACADAGLTFIGPSPEAIEAMGDKITAVTLADRAGVPRVPGSGALRDAVEAARVAGEIGHPVLLKAAAGGGGRGMRIVRREAELPAAFDSAALEARAAFGDPTLYVEKFIERARHVEIQVIGDRLGSVVHLGERECSTQRRHQKLIEEAPSPALDAAARERMAGYAVRLAQAVGYHGAGTVEFVLDESDGRFYFLEMNTRIQVEHPVTEMITGRDLVAEQIRVACGLPLSFRQDEVVCAGHAIECRINAEDADRDFRPSPGSITAWQAPAGEGVRVDTHCHAGASVPPHYDSLLAKVIVRAGTRADAIARMRQALAELHVEGVATTAPFHAGVLEHEDFTAGRVTTRWVEDVFLPQRRTAATAGAS